MPKVRRRKATQDRSSSPPSDEQPPLSKRQRTKAAKEQNEQMRARVTSFVQDTVNPGLRDLATEFNVPISDIRELAHLVVPATAKQRRLSLWQTVVSVVSEGSNDMAEASRRASQKYAELQEAIDAEDWDNEELVMYEAKRKELEAEREPVKIPSTTSKADRAVIAEVTRCGKDIEDMLHVLRNSSGVEFCVFICSGNDRISFPPHVYRSPKAADFFKLKTKLDSVLFAQEMAGYTQHGSKVYELLAVQDPKHKSFVSELLTGQLRELTGNPKVKMQWVECKEMCNKYNIRLVGWPDDIELLPMSKTTVGKARRLHLLIREGKLYFERLSAQSPAPTPAPALPPSTVHHASPSHVTPSTPAAQRMSRAAPVSAAILAPAQRPLSLGCGGESSPQPMPAPAHPQFSPSRPSTSQLGTTSAISPINMLSFATPARPVPDNQSNLSFVPFPTPSHPSGSLHTLSTQQPVFTPPQQSTPFISFPNAPSMSQHSGPTFASQYSYPHSFPVPTPSPPRPLPPPHTDHSHMPRS